MLVVWPSASVNDVGALDPCISRLDTQPAHAPVERFGAALAGVTA